VQAGLGVHNDRPGAAGGWRQLWGPARPFAAPRTRQPRAAAPSAPLALALAAPPPPPASSSQGPRLAPAACPDGRPTACLPPPQVRALLDDGAPLAEVRRSLPYGHMLFADWLVRLEIARGAAAGARAPGGRGGGASWRAGLLPLALTLAPPLTPPPPPPPQPPPLPPPAPKCPPTRTRPHAPPLPPRRRGVHAPARRGAPRPDLLQPAPGRRQALEGGGWGE
jgi:hypothetical protein